MVKLCMAEICNYGKEYSLTLGKVNCISCDNVKTQAGILVGLDFLSVSHANFARMSTAEKNDKEKEECFSVCLHPMC